jgi:hypothetical protein|tara:strand:+ start:2822 stop:3103 length:282 start_codon:yes stop_codon:yes gene_type:complete
MGTVAAWQLWVRTREPSLENWGAVGRDGRGEAVSEFRTSWSGYEHSHWALATENKLEQQRAYWAELRNDKPKTKWKHEPKAKLHEHHQISNFK